MSVRHLLDLTVPKGKAAVAGLIVTVGAFCWQPANAADRQSKSPVVEQSRDLYRSVIHAARAVATLGNTKPEGGRMSYGYLTSQDMERIRSIIDRNPQGLQCFLEQWNNDLTVDLDAFGLDIRDVTQIVGDGDADFLLINPQRIARLKSAASRLQVHSEQEISAAGSWARNTQTEDLSICGASALVDGDALLDVLVRGTTRKSLREMRLEAFHELAGMLVPYAEMLERVSPHAWMPADNNDPAEGQSPGELRFDSQQHEQEYRNFISEERKSKYREFEVRFKRYENRYQQLAERLYSLARIILDNGRQGD